MNSKGTRRNDSFILLKNSHNIVKPYADKRGATGLPMMDRVAYRFTVKAAPTGNSASHAKINQ